MPGKHRADTSARESERPKSRTADKNGDVVNMEGDLFADADRVRPYTDTAK